MVKKPQIVRDYQEQEIARAIAENTKKPVFECTHLDMKNAGKGRCKVCYYQAMKNCAVCNVRRAIPDGSVICRKCAKLQTNTLKTLKRPRSRKNLKQRKNQEAVIEEKAKSSSSSVTEPQPDIGAELSGIAESE